MMNHHCVNILLPIILLLIAGCTKVAENPAFFSEFLDERLTLELIDPAPNLVTPIDLAIDSQDNIYLLESHTHQPTKDYAGPKFDRINSQVSE